MKKDRLTTIKATLIRGGVFLIPIAAVLFLAGKLVVGLRAIAARVAPLLPVDSIAGLVVINLLAVLVVLVFCYLAGLFARSEPGKRLRATLEHGLLSSIPGYSFVKGLAESLSRSDELAQSFIPVAVRFDDCIQLAFEIERDRERMVAIYLPGAPNPWSGSVVYVTGDRVKPLEMSVTAAVKNIRMLGKGSLAYVQRHGHVFASDEGVS